MKIIEGILSPQGARLGLAVLLCAVCSALGASKDEAISSVYDATHPRDASGTPVLLRRAFTFQGVLTSRPAKRGDRVSVYFQDGTGGLVLFRPANDARIFDNFAAGDRIIVAGELGQMRGMEELLVKTIRLERSGDVPKPRDLWSIDLLGEEFSGQLVRVEGEVATVERNGETTFVLRDAHGEIPILVPTSFLEWNKGELSFKLRKGGRAEIIGVAGQDKASAPFDSGYGLIPRVPEDFQFPPPPPPPPPPPSRTPLYVALALAVLLGLLALYLWDRRRSAEQRTREVSRLLHEIRRSEAEVKKQAAFPQFNPNPVLEFFADGTMTYSNAAARELASALQKDTVLDVLPQNVRVIVRECIATRRAKLKCEVKLGGRTFAWSFFPILELNSVHAYGYDITEQLSLEAQLRQAQKLDSIGQLAAGIAHDFNNLLAVIQGYAGLSLLRGDLPPKLAEPLGEISIAAERATNLTRQLLTFSRRQTLEARTINLNELVGNLSKMLRRLLGEDVRLRFTPADSDAWIHADPGMIEQIIVNLAVNARDAMEDGGELSVSVCAQQLTPIDAEQRFEASAGDFICLTVTDTGCGMDEATLKRIFEPFFTTKEPGKGTGLGLATVHGIVKQHKGWIEVSSQPGKGSSFRVYLPAHAEKPAMTDQKLIRLPVAGGTETILLVEDDGPLRKLARSVLEEYGYVVLEAASAAEAIGIWKQRNEHIHLLLTDIVLPDGMSGWKLAEHLHADNAALKIIYTTGFDAETINRRFAPNSGLTLLRKPYPVQTLVCTVRDCLDSVPPVQALNTAAIS